MERRGAFVHGPASSGKTSLLREIVAEICHNPKWANELRDAYHVRPTVKWYDILDIETSDNLLVAKITVVDNIISTRVPIQKMMWLMDNATRYGIILIGSTKPPKDFKDHLRDRFRRLLQIKLKDKYLPEEEVIEL